MALRCSRTARSALDQSGLARVWQPRRRLFRSAVKQAAARAGRTRRWRLSVLRGGFNARRASSSPEPRSGSLSGARPTFSRGFEHVGRVSSRSREPRSRSRLRCLRRDDEREIAYMESELLASEAQVGNRVSWRLGPVVKLRRHRVGYIDVGCVSMADSLSTPMIQPSIFCAISSQPSAAIIRCGRSANSM